MERCSDCGEAFTGIIGLEAHRDRCTGSTADAVAGSFGDGTCPMCGEMYDRYIRHLHTCEAATGAAADTSGAEEAPATPAPTEAARHETDRPTWQ